MKTQEPEEFHPFLKMLTYTWFVEALLIGDKLPSGLTGCGASMIFQEICQVPLFRRYCFLLLVLGYAPSANMISRLLQSWRGGLNSKDLQQQIDPLLLRFSELSMWHVDMNSFPSWTTAVSLTCVRTIVTTQDLF